MRLSISNFVNPLTFALILYSISAAGEPAGKIAVDMAKMPTNVQMSEYDKGFHKFQDKDEKISREANDLSEKISDAVHEPGVQLTRGHIDAAMAIHKEMRSAYVEYFNNLIEWAKKSDRSACMHQAEKTKAYTTKVSDAWLAKVSTLSLSTQLDRITAFGIVQSGGGETFFPFNSDPVKYMVGREMEGLNAVCMGGQEEYEPGPK